jgi:hypothetical protein
MQDSLPAGGLRLYREGVEPSGSLRKVSGYISILLSRASPVARVIYAKRPFAGPAQVLDYVGRYTHRVAISNNRLLSMENGKVRFRWKDYRDGNRQKTMTLAGSEFIRRFLIRFPGPASGRSGFARSERRFPVMMCRGPAGSPWSD